MKSPLSGGIAKAGQYCVKAYAGRDPRTGVHFDESEGGAPQRIDLKTFENACMLGLTLPELALLFSVSLGTLKRCLANDPDFQLAFAKAYVRNKARVMKRGFELMQINGSAGATAWVHMTKHLLGWTDKQAIEHTGKDGGPIEIIRRTLADIEGQAMELPELAPELAPTG